MKILYTEDETFTRMIVKRILENENYTVYEASNGILGLKKFFEFKPDVIITDLSMPEMDGFEMITNIRKHNLNIPIILTTAYRDETEAVAGMINACIFKPIIRKDLLDAIVNLNIA